MEHLTRLLFPDILCPLVVRLNLFRAVDRVAVRALRCHGLQCGGRMAVRDFTRSQIAVRLILAATLGAAQHAIPENQHRTHRPDHRTHRGSRAQSLSSTLRGAAELISTKNGCERTMAPISIQKWHPKATKIAPKRIQNGTQKHPKWHAKAPKIGPKRIQHGTQKHPKWHP